jgi:hypothetical protein
MAGRRLKEASFQEELSARAPVGGRKAACHGSADDGDSIITICGRRQDSAAAHITVFGFNIHKLPSGSKKSRQSFGQKIAFLARERRDF